MILILPKTGQFPNRSLGPSSSLGSTLALTCWWTISGLMWTCSIACYPQCLMSPFRPFHHQLAMTHCHPIPPLPVCPVSTTAKTWCSSSTWATKAKWATFLVSSFFSSFCESSPIWPFTCVQSFHANHLPRLFVITLFCLCYFCDYKTK